MVGLSFGMKLYNGLGAEGEGFGWMKWFAVFVWFGFHGVDVNGLEWWCEFPDGITRDRAGYVFNGNYELQITNYKLWCRCATDDR